MEPAALDYERDIAIDHAALDVEWVRQPALMYKYAKHAAHTKSVMDEYKERLDVARAKLDTEIRTAPAAYGLEKVTESAIQSAILLQPAYQDSAATYSAARYEYEIASAAVRAVDQRKTALENLVRLLGMSYFAGPQTPRDLNAEIRRTLQQQEQKEHDAKIKINQQPRRTRTRS